MRRFIDLVVQSLTVAVVLPICVAVVLFGTEPLMREYVLWDIDQQTKPSRAWLGPAGESDYHRRVAAAGPAWGGENLGGCKHPRLAKNLAENSRMGQNSGVLGLRVIHNRHMLTTCGQVIPKGSNVSPATLAK